MGSSAERKGLTQHPAEYSAQLSNHSNYSDSKIYSSNSNHKHNSAHNPNLNMDNLVNDINIHGSPSPEDRQPTTMTNLTDSPTENNILLSGQQSVGEVSQAMSDGYRVAGGRGNGHGIMAAAAAPGRSGMPHSSAREATTTDPFQ